MLYCVCTGRLTESRRQVTGAHDTAVETVLLLRQVVSTARFSSIEQLLAMLRSVGTRLIAAQPKGALVPPLSHIAPDTFRMQRSPWGTWFVA
jgi:translation initiation factor 2B subunit (eIF-2B alpha/beta/delta family)